MCCFARAVLFVGSTKIFARQTGKGSQFLAYQMEFESEEPNAMILPLPVKVGSSEKSLSFIDLSEYEKLFDELASAFPYVAPSVSIGCSKSVDSAMGAIEVHQVGNFIASFVPTMDDFDRLDPQFVIPKETWLKIPSYSDYGFAVFQLEDLTGKPHPMAFEFETRNDDIFFPTVHIHDGEVHPQERFDHQLFVQHAAMDSVVSGYQNANVKDSATGFVRSKGPAKDYCQIEKSQGMLDPELLIHRVDLRGELENKDMIYSLAGDPVIPSFNFRSLYRFWPWTIAIAAIVWFFNRRGKLKQRKANLAKEDQEESGG